VRSFHLRAAVAGRSSGYIGVSEQLHYRPATGHSSVAYTVSTGQARGSLVNNVLSTRFPIRASSEALAHAPAFVASFDLEEHDRIEAASGLNVSAELRAEYGQRMESTTWQLLELLDEAGVKASWYIVGTIARTHPALVRAIHASGHEVGSHS